ncbi:MAG: 3-keto-5-aminohexanoate cleavage protein, partial [Actinobacteria bacterium]|nr:3-keto-5-aminohexanoate cleavage protein [Actinomycetota bacterium]
MANPIITAALTGPVATKADNPALPGSPQEIAESARDAAKA